jgi:hypothetical protein
VAPPAASRRARVAVHGTIGLLERRDQVAANVDGAGGVVVTERALRVEQESRQRETVLQEDRRHWPGRREQDGAVLKGKAERGSTEPLFEKDLNASVD